MLAIKKKQRAKSTIIVFFILAVGFTITKSTASSFILAADGETSVIRQYSLDGYEIGQITNSEFSFPTLLASDENGTSFVTDINFVGVNGPDLVRFGMDGQILARNSSANIFSLQGGGIVGVVDSGHKSFIVTSTLNTEIAEIGYNLQTIRKFSSNASAFGLKTLGVTMSPDFSKIYVADADYQSGSGFIRIFDYASGTQASEIRSPSIQLPVALDFDAFGHLFVSDRGASFVDDKMLVFDELGVLINQFTSGAAIHYNFGAFDILPDGDIVMIETTFPTDTPIRILTVNGEFVREFGAGLSNSNAIIAVSVPEPSALALLAVGLGGLAILRRRRL